MTTTPNDFDHSVASYDRWTQELDETIYGLCRKHPRHTDRGGVAAKCWIIGRTYATGIERQITSNGQQGDSMSRLVDWLADHAAKVDALIDRLHPLCEPLATDSLATIIDVHGQFVHLLAGIVRTHETPRSFASKYLHFHCPLVPIYDTVVAGVIRKLVRWCDGLMVFPTPKTAEGEYARYCYRFWNLYQQARTDLGDRLCVKLLDYHMLVLGGGPIMMVKKRVSTDWSVSCERIQNVVGSHVVSRRGGP